MKRALLLAYYFPPIAASGSLRPLGFCQHLHEYGYEAHVVSTDPDDAHPPVSQDADLLSRLPPGIRVDRLSHVNRLRQLLDLRDKLRGGRRTDDAEPEPSSPGKSSPGSPGIFSRIKTAVLNRLFLFPDHQKPWIRAVEKHVLALPKHERPDIVFATGNPWSGLVAGMRVARALGVPFVADFRDPWTRNPKPAVSEAIHRLSCKLERQVIESADLVIANTETLKQQFIDDYPLAAGKIEVLTNGYGEHLLELMGGAQEVAPQAAIELCHFGSVYELRKPDRLLEAVANLQRSGRLTAGQMRIRFLGHWGVEDASCNALAQSLESEGFISREAALPHSEYLQAMTRAQHLLILQQDFPLQIPGKLYEYIASGRPLIMIGGAGATSDLIESNHLGRAVDNDTGAIEAFLESLPRGQCQLPPPAPEAVRQFGYASLTGRLAAYFDRLLQVDNTR